MASPSHSLIRELHTQILPAVLTLGQVGSPATATRKLLLLPCSSVVDLLLASRRSRRTTQPPNPKQFVMPSGRKLNRFGDEPGWSTKSEGGSLLSNLQSWSLSPREYCRGLGSCLQRMIWIHNPHQLEKPNSVDRSTGGLSSGLEGQGWGRGPTASHPLGQVPGEDARAREYALRWRLTGRMGRCVSGIFHGK